MMARTVMKRKFHEEKKSREHRARDPQKISDVIADLFARRGYAQLHATEECQTAWASVVDGLAKFSRATEVKRGVLHVLVSNSVVMQELTFRKTELVGEIAKALPSHEIRDIRFKIAAIS